MIFFCQGVEIIFKPRRLEEALGDCLLITKDVNIFVNILEVSYYFLTIKIYCIRLLLFYFIQRSFGRGEWQWPKRSYSVKENYIGFAVRKTDTDPVTLVANIITLLDKFLSSYTFSSYYFASFWAVASLFIIHNVLFNFLSYIRLWNRGKCCVNHISHFYIPLSAYNTGIHG